MVKKTQRPTSRRASRRANPTEARDRPDQRNGVREPLFLFDPQRGRYGRSGVHAALEEVLDFHRESSAYTYSSEGEVRHYSAHQPRILEDGLLLEGGRQNLIALQSLNEAFRATLAPGPYTATVWGDGALEVRACGATLDREGASRFGEPLRFICRSGGQISVQAHGRPHAANLERGEHPTSPISALDDRSQIRANERAKIMRIGVGASLTIIADLSLPTVSLHSQTLASFGTDDRNYTTVYRAGDGGVVGIAAVENGLERPHAYTSVKLGEDSRLRLVVSATSGQLAAAVNGLLAVGKVPVPKVETIWLGQRPSGAINGTAIIHQVSAYDGALADEQIRAFSVASRT